MRIQNVAMARFAHEQDFPLSSARCNLEVFEDDQTLIVRLTYGEEHKRLMQLCLEPWQVERLAARLVQMVTFRQEPLYTKNRLKGGDR